jgi:hypothetical protein
MPRAFHYLPFDYVILNSNYFREFFLVLLKKHEKKDRKFRECIQRDMGGRAYTEAGVNFILGEAAVTHLIRQRIVEFPRTLVRDDWWRLIVYHGAYLESDAYQWKKKNVAPERYGQSFSRGTIRFF